MIIQINILVVDKKFPVDYPKCGGPALSTSDHCIYMQRFAKWVAKEILLFHGLIFLKCLSFFVKVCEVTRLTRNGQRLERREHQPQIERSQ